MSDPLATIERDQQRDINMLFRTLADAIRNAAADLPGDQAVTTFESSAILREVDAGLDVIFGRYQGDPDAALRTIVVRDTDRARLRPLDAAVEWYRKAMPAEIVDAMEADHV